MKIVFFYFFLITTFFSTSLTAFQRETISEDISCSEMFSDLTEKIEANYIALALMKRAGNETPYENKKANFHQRSVNIEPLQCIKFLNEFLLYFEDNHLFVTHRPEYSKEDLIAFKNYTNKEKVTKNQMDQWISEVHNPLSLEGKWTNGTSEYVITKTNEKDIYKAYIYSSTEKNTTTGALKAYFKPSISGGYNIDYYSLNNGTLFKTGDVYKEGTFLRLSGGTAWDKMKFSSKRELEMLDYPHVNKMEIEQIDKKNTLISIPSFGVDYSLFGQLLEDNDKLLKNSENLIIDIRGNTGGNAIYFSLINYYATQNMQDDKGLVLSSDATIRYFERFTKGSSKEVYQPLVDRMKNNLGKIVEGPNYQTITFEPMDTKIKNVAILTDQGVMSAAESFILHSKKSSTKVATFGTPTAGVIDYTSVNVIKLKSGKHNIYFGYPTGTLNKNVFTNGYNKTGIVPNVPIPSNIVDKVQYIVAYFE